MEYPIVIEYLKSAKNTIAEILSCFTGHSLDRLIPYNLASGIPTYACPVDNADRLELRTRLLNQQRADTTISSVVHHLVNNTKIEDDKIKLNPALQLYMVV